MAIDDNSTANTTLSPPNNQQAGVGSLTSWPGAFGLFKHSKAAVMVNLSTILVLFLINFAVFFVLEVFLEESLSTSVQSVVSPFFYAALVLTFLASIRGNRVSVGEKLSESPRYFINLFLLQLLVGLSVFVGLLLFIVPGIILLARLFVAEYYLIDKNMSAIEAYKASLAATKGNLGKVFGIIGASLVMVLTAITIIGIPIAIYLVFMYSAASALLYQHLSGLIGAENGANNPNQTPNNFNQQPASQPQAPNQSGMPPSPYAQAVQAQEQPQQPKTVQPPEGVGQSQPPPQQQTQQVVQPQSPQPQQTASAQPPADVQQPQPQQPTQGVVQPQSSADSEGQQPPAQPPTV